MPAIRAKAVPLEARGAGRINLAAETTGLAALRHLATEGMVERKASYRVEVWDASGNHIVEHIGSLSNMRRHEPRSRQLATRVSATRSR